jgi:hypothetical protein
MRAGWSRLPSVIEKAPSGPRNPVKRGVQTRNRGRAEAVRQGSLTLPKNDSIRIWPLYPGPRRKSFLNASSLNPVLGYAYKSAAIGTIGDRKDRIARSRMAFISLCRHRISKHFKDPKNDSVHEK